MKFRATQFIFIAVIAVAFAFQTACAFAQPPDLPPQVQAQTKNGFTVRLKRAYWNTPEDNSGKGLAVEFEAETATMPHSGDLTYYLSDMQIRGPKGELVYTQPQDRYVGGSVFLSSVNPHWRELLFDLEMQTPSEDWRGARGQISKELIFQNLTLPTQNDQSVAIGQTLTAALGTKVTLRDVTLKDKMPGSDAPAYVFLVDFENDGKIGDLAFGTYTNTILSRDTPVITEAQPQTRRRQLWQISIEKSRLNPQDLLKKTDFHLTVTEWAPSQKKAGDFKRFRFKVPLKNLPDLTPYYRKNRIIAKAQTKVVHVEIEDWGKPAWGSKLRLWTRPTNPKSIHGWIVKSLHFESYTLSTAHFYSPGWAGWKADGRIAQRQENSFDFQLNRTLPNENELREGEKPPTYQLKVELEEARHADSRFAFPNLPVPAEGAVMPINRKLRAASGSEWTILAVATYRDQKLPAKWPIPAQFAPSSNSGESNKNLQPPDGIALSCRWKPAVGIKTIQARHYFVADDQLGHSMLEAPFSFFLPLPLQKKTSDQPSQARELQPIEPKASHDFTLVVLPPARGVSKFSVNLSLRETIVTGAQETVTLPLSVTH